MFSTGQRGPQPANWLGVLPMTVRHCCCVTSVWPRKYGRGISTSCSSSSSLREASVVALPMVKRPGGSSTSIMPVHGSVVVAIGV